MKHLFDVVGLIGWLMLGVGTAFQFSWPIALMLNGGLLLAIVLGGLAWKRRIHVSR